MGEAAVRGVVFFLGRGRFGSLPDPVARLAMLQNAGTGMLYPAMWGSWVVLAFALGVAVLAIVPALRRAPKPTYWAAFAWLFVSVLPMLLADVSLAAWTAMAQALGTS